MTQKSGLKMEKSAAPVRKGALKSVILYITVFLSESGHFNPQIMIHLYEITRPSL